jgi:acetyl esterase/lipase
LAGSNRQPQEKEASVLPEATPRPFSLYEKYNAKRTLRRIFMRHRSPLVLRKKKNISVSINISKGDGMLKPLISAGSIILFFAGVSLAETIKNIDYIGDGKTEHTLTMYSPSSGSGPFPVVIQYPGLAFTWGDSKGDGGLASSFNAAGFIVVGPDVSGGGSGAHCATYPTQIQELKATVRFLRANAAKYKIDTKFIGVIGFSSGAWNTVMLATTGDVKKFAAGSTTMDIEGSLGGNLDFSSRVQAAWAAAAPTDFLKMDSCGSDINHGAANSPEGSLIGGALAQNKDKCQLANPITYVTLDDPPIHLVHGTSDRTVPTCQSVLLYNALKASGNKHEMTYTPASGGHAQNYTGALDFFKKALAANKEGCLDPKNPKFDSLATYYMPVATLGAPAHGMRPIERLQRANNDAAMTGILSPGRHSLRIFDASGAEVMSEYGFGKTKCRVGEIKHGIYFVKVTLEGKTRIEKMARF